MPGSKLNIGSIFTRDKQKKVAPSIFGSYDALGKPDDETTLLPLYKILASDKKNELIGNKVFPDVVIMTSGTVFMPSNRWIKVDAANKHFEWFFTFTKDDVLITDYKNGYVEILPTHKILKIYNTHLSQATIEVDGVYDLSNTKYSISVEDEQTRLREQYEESKKREEEFTPSTWNTLSSVMSGKPIEDEMLSEFTTPKKEIDTTKTLYVPKAEKVSKTMESFLTAIRNGRVRLPSNNI